MRKAIASLLLLSIYLIQISCATEEEDSVLILTDDNFEEEIKIHENILVEFYAPWCGHCQQLAPEYAKAAAILRSQNPSFYLAKVDATANQNLNTKFSLEGFPTINFWANGEWIEYTGGRTSKEIVAWVNKRMSPPSKEIVSLESFAKETESEDGTYVIYIGNNTNESFSNYTNVAKIFDNIIFFHTTNQEILKKFSASLGQIVLLKSFDEKLNKFSGEHSEENLIKFIFFYSLPLISPFDEKCAETIFEGNNVGLFYIRSQHMEEQTKFDSILNKLAPDYREKIIFVVCDIKNEIEERLAEYLKIKEADLPQIRLIDVNGEENVNTYLMQDDITEENLKVFIHNFQNDKLTPFVLSEEEPQSQDGPVFKLVGTTFNRIVLEREKNVLIKIYAPGCTDCEKLETIYTQLAEYYSGNNNLLIAKIDATVNDLPSDIEEFPTIIFYPAKEKLYPMTYPGEIDFNELVKFVDGLINSQNNSDISKSDL